MSDPGKAEAVERLCRAQGYPPGSVGDMAAPTFAREAIAVVYPVIASAVRDATLAEIADLISKGPLREGEGATRSVLAEYVRNYAEARCGERAYEGANPAVCGLHQKHSGRHWQANAY